MQNRFTVKDFFYMLIGLAVCLLLFINTLKTDREVESLERVNATLGSQQSTLSTLGDALEVQKGAIGDLARAVREMEAGPALDAEVLAALRDAMTEAGDTRGEQTVGTPLEATATNANAYQPGFNPANRNPWWTRSVNNEGLPQDWQAAPNADLPDDFAPGGTLVQVWKTDAQKLTPLVATDAYSRRIHWYVLEYLVNHDLDAPFGYTPGLAKAWEVSEDGMELTFHLFENARWSDGTPLTADDVIFTWDTALNEKMDTAHLRGYLEDNVEKYEKIDEHTVRFTMKQPYFDAVGVTGQLLPIIPKHVYEDYSPEAFNTEIPDVLVGSGPFVLERWSKNNEIVLARNENYWGPKPALERYLIRVIPNDLPGLQEFKANNVDLLEPTGEQWVANAEADWMKERNAQKFLFYSPRGGYAYIGYNLRRPHFADKRTRQALTMLIDRQKLIDTVLEGMGTITTGPFFFKSDQYNQEVEPWPYDPERARALLREVGWEDSDGDGIIDKDLDGDGIPDPFEVTYLLPSGGSGGEKIQRFVQDAFKQAGIKLNLDQLEWSVFLERLNEREYDMVTLSWTGGPEGDPYQIWHSASEPNRGSNHVGFINAEADALIEAGRRELDYEKRMEIWHKFHALVHEEQPYTFLYARPTRFFLDERFRNAKEHDYRLYYPEWYVPAAEQVR